MQFTTPNLLALAAILPIFMTSTFAAAISASGESVTGTFQVTPGNCGVHVQMHIPGDNQQPDGEPYTLFVQLKDAKQKAFASWGTAHNMIASPASLDSILKQVFIVTAQSSDEHAAYTLGADQWDSGDITRCKMGALSLSTGTHITRQIDCDFACTADMFNTLVAPIQ